LALQALAPAWLLVLVQALVSAWLERPAQPSKRASEPVLQLAPEQILQLELVRASLQASAWALRQEPA